MFALKITSLLCLVCLVASQFPAAPAAAGGLRLGPSTAAPASFTLPSKAHKAHVAPVYHAAPAYHAPAPAPAYHAPAPVYHAPGPHHAEPTVPTSYSFEYGVKDEHTHDFKSQHEQKDNAHHVVGAYELVEPDGSKRLVNYTSDEHVGFHAHVTKEGPYLHPDGAHSYHNFNLYQA